MARTVDELEKARVSETFKSRKNRVFTVSLDGQLYIAKVFDPGRREAAEKEFGLLTECHDKGVMVPAPFELVDRAIVMEFVRGRTAAEEFDATSARDGDLAKALADWLSSFHRAFGMHTVRGDTILRNFILSRDGMFGVDLEESGEDDPVTDLGQLCASVLSMDPLFSDRSFDFADILISRYAESTGRNIAAEVPPATARALRHYAPFRKDENDLLAWADRIERRKSIGEQ